MRYSFGFGVWSLEFRVSGFGGFEFRVSDQFDLTHYKSNIYTPKTLDKGEPLRYEGT
jgi:hypothetical protein